MIANHSDSQLATTASNLLRWYSKHHMDRDFPWRRYGASLLHVAMTEAILPHVPAEILSQNFEAVFKNIKTFSDWLSMGNEERFERMSFMGLGTEAVEAVNGTLSTIISGYAIRVDSVLGMKGISRQSAAMVAMLYGGKGVPCDLLTNRVANRVYPYAEKKWVEAVLDAGRDEKSVSGRPPRYEIARAISDIGNIYCKEKAPDCADCPLLNSCVMSSNFDQCSISTERKNLQSVYKTHRLRLSIINLDVENWVAKDVKVDVGVQGDGSSLAEINSAVFKKLPTDNLGNVDMKGSSLYLLPNLIIGVLPDRMVWCRAEMGWKSETAWKRLTKEINKLSIVDKGGSIKTT